MCFPQLGAESDWRTADTASFKDEATKDGFKLVFSDAQQKQENQSLPFAVHPAGCQCYCAAPVVEDGFDAVLTEAKNAGIPVIIVDRSVSSDPSLYAAHIGSNMDLEGQRAAAEFNKLLRMVGQSLNSLEQPARCSGRPRQGIPREAQFQHQDYRFADRQLHPRGSYSCDAGFPAEIQSGHGFPGHIHS